MESALYSLFQIDVRNLVKNRLYIAKEYHIQPSEVLNMVFFEYEYMIEDIKEHQKEREAQQEKEEKEQQMMTRQMKNPYGSGFKMPSMPNYGNMKAPSMPSMPNFANSMPKFP